MTPTEQDKELREQIEGIFKNPHCESCHEDWDYDSSYRTDECCTRFMEDSISKVVQLFTADREQAIEAYHNEITDNERKVWIYREVYDKRIKKHELQARIDEWKAMGDFLTKADKEALSREFLDLYRLHGERLKAEREAL